MLNASSTGLCRPRPCVYKQPVRAEAQVLVPQGQWNREGWRPATPPLQSLAMVWSSFGLDIAAREIFEQLTNSFLGAVRLANITAHGTVGIRSEERRVGKECVSTCRSRWSPYH